jgi:hypothetical protein
MPVDVGGSIEEASSVGNGAEGGWGKRLISDIVCAALSWGKDSDSEAPDSG